MLSRTAANLYWMSRYIERAENLARALDVSASLALLPKGGGHQDDIAVPLHVSGTLEDFKTRFDAINTDNLWAYLGYATDHPASIASCLRLARENAHAVRGTITAEMWENLNATWLECKDLVKTPPPETAYFSDWVKQRSHLFRGITYGTILREDAYRFIRLGTFVERADNTARLLQVKSLAPLKVNDDYYHLTSLLRSVSAFEAYQACYRESIGTRRVAELLILRPNLPRSLRASLDEINAILPQIGGERGKAAKKLAAKMGVALEYGDIDDIVAEGLSGFLARFLADINRLGTLVQTAYLEAL